MLFVRFFWLWVSFLALTVSLQNKTLKTSYFCLARLVVTIHFSVHMLFPQVFQAFIHGFFLQQERRIHTITLMHYSLSKFTGEWFANHSNPIHICTPITRIVTTKLARLFLKSSYPIKRCLGLADAPEQFKSRCVKTISFS